MFCISDLCNSDKNINCIMQFFCQTCKVLITSFFYKNYTQKLMCLCVYVCVLMCAWQEVNKQPWWLTMFMAHHSVQLWCFPFLFVVTACSGLTNSHPHCDLPSSPKMDDGEHWKWEMEGNVGVLLRGKPKVALEEGEEVMKSEEVDEFGIWEGGKEKVGGAVEDRESR